MFTLTVLHVAAADEAATEAKVEAVVVVDVAAGVVVTPTVPQALLPMSTSMMRAPSPLSRRKSLQTILVECSVCFILACWFLL